MTEWRAHEIAPDVRVRVTRPLPALPDALEAEVERLWLAAQARTGGALFNGRVFSADTISPTLIEGHWTEYRRVVARMDRPDLAPGLAACPVAAGGMIVGGAGDERFVLFGRRPARAVYQPGEWQLPPAGSLDPGAADGAEVLPVRQLLTELAEELGLPPDAVEHPRPLLPRGTSRQRHFRFWHRGAHALERRGAAAGARRRRQRRIRSVAGGAAGRPARLPRPPRQPHHPPDFFLFGPRGAHRVTREERVEMFIFGRFHAREGEEEKVAAALRAVRGPTRQEPGCLEQDVYRSTRDPRLFYVHSRWVDEAAFEAHARLPHTVHFIETVEPLLDHPLDVTRARPLDMP